MNLHMLAESEFSVAATTAEVHQIIDALLLKVLLPTPTKEAPPIATVSQTTPPETKGKTNGQIAGQ